MVAPSRILLSGPDISELENEFVAKSIASGWVAPLGPDVDAFESEMANQVGVQHAVALNSGTAALHLGLKVLGVKQGDSVITGTMTFVATANAISYNGAEPVFVDSVEDGSLDPKLLKVAIESELRSGRRVGAIVPVDLYGRLADYSEIIPIAEQFEIPVLADAAESVGSSRLGKNSGAWGDAAVFSFNGNKIMTTSGGGMLLTSDPEKASYARFLAAQAKETSIHYEHREVGFNYRMSSLCASLGRAQLARLPEMIARRRARRVRYGSFFSGIDGVEILPGSVDEDNCWLTSITVSPSVAGWSASELRQFLERKNIESRPFWKPMHLQPLYKGARFFGSEVAESLFRIGLVLPSGSVMSDGDMDRVLDTIAAFLESR